MQLCNEKRCLFAEDLEDCYITDAFSPKYTVPANTPFPDFTSPAGHRLQVQPTYYPSAYGQNGDHLAGTSSSQAASIGMVQQYKGIMPNVRIAYCIYK